MCGFINYINMCIYTCILVLRSVGVILVDTIGSLARSLHTISSTTGPVDRSQPPTPQTQ